MEIFCLRAFALKYVHWLKLMKKSNADFPRKWVDIPENLLSALKLTQIDLSTCIYLLIYAKCPYSFSVCSGNDFGETKMSCTSCMVGMDLVMYRLQGRRFIPQMYIYNGGGVLLYCSMLISMHRWCVYAVDYERSAWLDYKIVSFMRSVSNQCYYHRNTRFFICKLYLIIYSSNLVCNRLQHYNFMCQLDCVEYLYVKLIKYCQICNSARTIGVCLVFEIWYSFSALDLYALEHMALHSKWQRLTEGRFSTDRTGKNNKL